MRIEEVKELCQEFNLIWIGEYNIMATSQDKLLNILNNMILSAYKFSHKNLFN